MNKLSKRYKKLKTLIDNKLYSYKEAIFLLKKLGNTKFIESTEGHIKLNIDLKQINKQFKFNILLPYNIIKNINIAIFTNSENISEFKNLGAIYVGYENILDLIKNEKLNFDLLITTPQLMPELMKYGKILGPKGLMPSTKSGTISKNLIEIYNELKQGKICYRPDKTGIFHFYFGKINFLEEHLIINLITIYKEIEKLKFFNIKNNFFSSFTICSTMSPSIKLDLTSFKNL